MKKVNPPAKKNQGSKVSGPKAISHTPFFLNRILNAYGAYISGAILLVLLLLLFRDYVFGEKLLLFKDIGSDTINTFWPQFYHFSSMLRSKEIPKWSFNMGLGQNVFPAMLGDPLSWILYIVEPDSIPNTLVYAEMFKMFLAGMFFFLFLKKLGLTTYSSLLGAVLYCFCGFMTVGAAWFIFTTEGCYFAIMLYSMELLRQNNNFIVFPLSVALLGARNGTLLYMGAILIVAYLIFLFVLKGFNRPSFLFIAKLFLLGVLGTGISALMLFGNVYQMLESPRGSGNTSQFSKLMATPVLSFAEESVYKTYLLRIFGNDMMGYINSWKGWKNYLEAPATYCSMLTLLLIPQLFVVGSKKLKWLAGVTLAAVIIPVLFPFFRYAFWLFSGNYFRCYGLFVTILEVLLALKTLDLVMRQKKINAPLLTATFILLSLIIFLSSLVNGNLVVTVFVFLLIEFLLLLSFAYTRYYQAALLALPLVVSMEVVSLSSGTFNERENINKTDLKERTGYKDNITDAVKYIRYIDKGFYRIHKDKPSGVSHNSSLNDAMIQDYYSSACYGSFNQKYYVNFLQQMKLISDTSQSKAMWVTPLQNFMLMQLIGGKYFLAHDHYPSFGPPEWDSIATVNGITILRSKFGLPLGVTYSSVISETEMDKIPLVRKGKDIMILKAAVISDSLLTDDFKEFEKATANDTAGFTFEKYWINDSIYNSILKKDTLEITKFSNNHIEGKINTSSKKLLYMSIPYDKGWTAVIDGKKVKPMIVNYGFLGFLLDKGQHTLDLTFEPVYYEAGLRISAVSILLFLVIIVIGVLVRIKNKRADLPA